VIGKVAEEEREKREPEGEPKTRGGTKNEQTQMMIMYHRPLTLCNIFGISFVSILMSLGA
jgi:hypothetical protein